MRIFFERRERALKETKKLVKPVYNQLQESRNVARFQRVLDSSETEFEVEGLTNQYTVNLELKCCSCMEWQKSGIICKHGVAAVMHKRLDPEEYVEDVYLTETYQKTYQKNIAPMPSPSMWLELPLEMKRNVLPPATKRPPGRPKKRKQPSNGFQQKRKLTCSRCKQQINHNRRTCREVINNDADNNNIEPDISQEYLVEKIASTQICDSQEA